MIYKINNEVEKNNQKLVVVRNYGLINYLRLYENYHGSFQLRLPDNPVTDLRIPNAWKELEEFCLNFDLDSMDEMSHKHVPYVIILIQALNKFKSINGKLPSSSLDKKQYKEIIKSLKKYEDEENFNEALNFYYHGCQDKANLINDELAEIFKILKENYLETLLSKCNVMMSIFFIVCKALLVFYERFQTLPVVGILADMTSDTETYIKLKKM